MCHKASSHSPHNELNVRWGTAGVGEVSDLELSVWQPGADGETNYALSGRATVGRDASCAVRLASKMVSRRHCQIWLELNGEVWVQDLGSKNGTSVGNRILHDESAPLTTGALVGVGPYLLDVFANSRETTVTANALSTGSGDAHSRLSVDRKRHLVLLDGQPLIERLPPREFTFLAALADRAPAYCTSAELGDAIWGVDGLWTDDMLHHVVAAVRARLGAAAESESVKQLVINTPAVGYRLV